MGSRVHPLVVESPLEPTAATAGAQPRACDDTSPEAVQCDACDGAIVREDDDDGYALGGVGVYVWTRGEEVRREVVALCPRCAAAIGVSALARWESEEEEG